METTSNTFEILALFAVAAMICWPAIRKYLPLPSVNRRESSDKPRARFEPKPPARDVDPTSVRPLLSPVPDAVYDDDPQDVAAPPPGDEHVLPLAEALLRGEQASTATPNGTNGASNGDGSLRLAVAATQTSVGGAANTSPTAKSSAPAAAPQANSTGQDSYGSDVQEPQPPIPGAAVNHRDEPQVFKILLIDDREKFRTAMLLRLARAGHRVFPVNKAREALDVFTRENCESVLVHREALMHAGADFVRRIRSVAPYVPILVHGGMKDAGDVGPLKNGVDITVVASAQDDPDVLADMINCALSASKCLRSVREDQLARGKILAELCHDLRSSLEVVSGYSDILKAEPELSRFQAALSQMQTAAAVSAAHLQTYIDIALDVSDATRQERVEISTLPEKIQRMVQSRIGAHPLSLSTTGQTQDCALFTDEEKLLAILSHVITDAIKFTPTGEINIDVRSSRDRTDFTITDAGPGISADAPMLFASVPPPENDGSTGDTSGVGLAIAERLSRSIGATLSGTCGEGGAAAFTISVPGKLMTTHEGAAATLH